MALRLGSLIVDIGADTSGLRSARREVNGVSRAMDGLKKKIAAALTVEAARRVILIADNMQVLERQLIRFTGSADSARDSMNALVSTASQVGSTVDDVVSVFQRFSLIRDEIGASNADILEFTDTLSKMGAIGGSSGEELKNALRQLSQSFSGGILRAEEYNSIVEMAPEIIKRMGKEMGITMGDFRKEMLAGKITSDRMFDATQASAEDVNSEFESMPTSILAATQALKNNLAVAIKNIDDNFNFSEAVSEGIKSITAAIVEMNKEAEKSSKLGEILNTGNPQNARARRKNGGSQKTEEQKAAEEVNKLLEKNISLENSLGESNRFRGANRSKLYREQQEQIKEEIAANEIKIEQLKKESELAQKVASIHAGEKNLGEESDEPQKVDIGRTASAKEENQIEKLRQLGETEREEIARIAEERRAFVAEQTQLDQEEKNKLLDNINEEERAKIAELAESHLEQIRQLNETEIEEIERLAQEKRDFVLAQDQLEADERAALMSEIEENRLSKLQEQADKEVEIAKRAAADKKAADEKSFNDRISGLTTANEAMSALNQTALGENKELAAIQAGISLAISMAKASEVGFPQNIPLIAGAAAQGAQIKSLLAGSGRVNGGQTSHQLATPINEAGVPEIYQEGSRQYLMPTGGSGKVIPLDSAGGGSNSGSMPNINIYNNGAPISIDSTQITKEEIKIMISQSEKRINTSLATGRGDSANAVKKGFKLERNLNG